jgi:hypothetical protein
LLKNPSPWTAYRFYLADENGKSLNWSFQQAEHQHKLTLNIGEGTPGRIVENGEHVHIHDLSVFYETFSDFIHFAGEEKLEGSISDRSKFRIPRSA